MRFLSFLILISPLVMPAFAKKAKPDPKLLFTAKVVHRHGNQETTIYREGQDWICSTEIKKIYFAGRKKFKMSLFQSVMRAGSAQKKGVECREQLTLIDHEKAKTKKNTCPREADVKPFLDELARYCGR